MLSKKAERAVELMKTGAYWRKALETGYRGREMFETRLRGESGVIRGFGFKTWLELEEAGMLAWRECPSSSTWPTEWVLSTKKEVAKMKSFKVSVSTATRRFPETVIVKAETAEKAIAEATGRFEGGKLAWGTEAIEVHPVTYEPIKRGAK